MGVGARHLKVAGAAIWVALWEGFRGTVCRVGGCLSVAEIPATCQEPEGLELTITGATGTASSTLDVAGPATGEPWGAGSRGGWRITGEEISTWLLMAARA